MVGFLRIGLCCVLCGWVVSAQAFRFGLHLEAPQSLRPLLENHLDIWRWRDSERITPEQLTRMVEQLPEDTQRLLDTEGYFQAAAITAHIDRSTPDVWQVHLQVNPGRQARVGQVNIQLIGEVKNQPDAAAWQQQIQNEWSLTPDEIFLDANWRAAKKRGLQALLRDRFPAAKVLSSAVQVDPQSGLADLHVTYDSGPLFTLGPVRVTGLKRYPESIVHHLTGFSVGAPYSQQSLLDFQTALQNTPYFDSVFVDTELDLSHPDRTPIQLTVTEAPTQKVGVGVGYSSNTGERAALSYQHANLFDRGWILKAQATWELLQQSANLSLTLPVDEKGYVDDVVLRQENKDIQGLETHTRSLRASRSQARGWIDRNFAVQYLEESAFTPQSEQHRRALTLNWQWTRRDVDNVLYPRRGTIWHAELGGAVRGALSDTSFSRWFVRGVGYWPLRSEWGRWVVRAEAGQVLAQSSDQLPNEVLFRTGGSQSIRGYSFESLGVNLADGSVVGGQVLAVASLEYLYPVARHWEGAVFMDAGNAAASWASYRPVHAYGVGARWASPIGPLALDLAYGAAASNWRMHFSLNMAF